MKEFGSDGKGGSDIIFTALGKYTKNLNGAPFLCENIRNTA